VFLYLFLQIHFHYLLPQGMIRCRKKKEKLFDEGQTYAVDKSEILTELLI